MLEIINSNLDISYPLNVFSAFPYGKIEVLQPLSHRLPKSVKWASVLTDIGYMKLLCIYTIRVASFHPLRSNWTYKFVVGVAQSRKFVTLLLWCIKTAKTSFWPIFCRLFVLWPYNERWNAFHWHATLNIRKR